MFIVITLRAESLIAATAALPAGERRSESHGRSFAVRGLSCRDGVTLLGLSAMCFAHGARRAWMPINRSPDVRTLCGCAQQRLEPETSRADFEAATDVSVHAAYPAARQATPALGLDG